MEQLQEVPGNLLLDEELHPPVLAGPQVLDELALAVGPALGEPVRLRARKLLDIPRVVVADEVAEAALVRGASGHVNAPPGAPRVHPSVVGADLPGLEDLVRLLVVLGDDEAGVEVELAELVPVVAQVRVGCHGQRVGLGVDVPVVHQPLERQVEAVENGVRVEVDACLVIFEDFANHGRLLPRCSPIFE